MHNTKPSITAGEREALRPFLSLIRDPDQLYARTTSGEFFEPSELDCLLRHERTRR